MSSFWEYPAVQFLFAIWVRVAFAMLGVIQVPFMLVAERLILPAERERFWRLVSHKNAKILLKIAGIKIDLRTQLPHYDHSVIFASNHPSWMDGFLIMSMVGPDFTSLIAPYGSFPYPFNIWLKKAGAIDVQRDAYDEEHHPEAHKRQDAIGELIAALNEKHNNVLIFPEGHLERTNQLHYIHTGAARVSIRSGIPVLPMSLIGLDTIVLSKLKQRPGTLTVRFDGLVQPPQVSKKLPYRKAVQVHQKAIRASMLQLLPVRYLPDYLADYEPETTGVFIDIDHTIYKGYSQQDFVKYLFKQKIIKKKIALKIFWWLLLEKLHVLPHKQLMKLSLSIMKGWTVKEVEKHAKNFFDHTILQGIQEHMIPIIKDHQEQGHVIVLVTEVISPLAKQFKKYFNAVAVLDTTLVHKKGVYTGEVELLNWRENKAAQVKAFTEKMAIDLKTSYVYADSISDLPMMELVEYKTAVHPDPDLRREAKSHNWPILV